MAEKVLPEIGMIERRIDGRCVEVMIGANGELPVVTATPFISAHQES